MSWAVLGPPIQEDVVSKHKTIYLHSSSLGRPALELVNLDNERIPIAVRLGEFGEDEGGADAST